MRIGCSVDGMIVNHRDSGVVILEMPDYAASEVMEKSFLGFI